MDDRTYIRLHDGMPDHPKVVGLSDRAFRLYVESLCWCSRHLTDGRVTVAAMKRMGGFSPAALRELATARLLESGTDSSWDIHDYTQHQRTADEVADAREAKRSAGVTGNHERWHLARGLSDPSCELCAIASATPQGSHNGQLRDPNSSQETETDTEKKRKANAQVGSDADPDFCQFWSAYPKKVGKGQARRAWRTAVLGQHVDPKVIILATEHYQVTVRERGILPKYIPYPATWLNGERWGDSDSEERGIPDDDEWEDE